MMENEREWQRLLMEMNSEIYQAQTLLHAVKAIVEFSEFKNADNINDLCNIAGKTFDNMGKLVTKTSLAVYAEKKSRETPHE